MQGPSSRSVLMEWGTRSASCQLKVDCCLLMAESFHRNCPGPRLCFLPRAACIQWLVDAGISEPRLLASVQEICEEHLSFRAPMRLAETSVQPHTTLTSLSKIQFVLLIYRYCSQGQSSINLLHQILMAKIVPGEPSLREWLYML